MTEDTDTTAAKTTTGPAAKERVSDATPEGDIPDPTPEGSDLESEQDDEGDTIVYKRADLEKLRQENGRYRQRAQRADELAQRLHAELVRATGKLADPTDLPFDEDHIADAGKMVAAIDDLLTRKPHLASRRPVGEIGQGPSPSAGGVDLAAILRGKAG